MLIANELQQPVDDGRVQIVAHGEHRLGADQRDVASRRERHEPDGARGQSAPGQERVAPRIGIRPGEIHGFQRRVGQGGPDRRRANSTDHRRIHPNIWHEGVFAASGAPRFLDRQGAVHARVSVDFAREFGCLLEAPLP